MEKAIVDEEVLITTVLYPPDLENHIWVTKYKEKIPVREMSTTHIKNCLAAFESGRIPSRYLGGKERWYFIFNQELINRQ